MFFSVSRDFINLSDGFWGICSDMGSQVQREPHRILGCSIPQSERNGFAPEFEKAKIGSNCDMPMALKSSESQSLEPNALRPIIFIRKEWPNTIMSRKCHQTSVEDETAWHSTPFNLSTIVGSGTGSTFTRLYLCTFAEV